jgi:NOL1/NOP2/sun family putative RNA methylase
VQRTASIGDARRRLPAAFLQALDAGFPQPAAERILRGMGGGRRTTLRVNTLRCSAAAVMEFFREGAVRVRRVPWYADGFILDSATGRDVQAWDLYREGRIYMQGVASMLPALILDPRPGERILDVAAAPGSKTTQMAALMQNTGTICANDADPVRCERLAYNVRLQGCSMVEVRTGRGEKLGEQMPGQFDRVLVDAPCSGEGGFIVFEPGTSRSWSPRLVAESVRAQRKLLASAALAVKPGGVVVYSTCTLNAGENEDMVQWAVQELGLRPEKPGVTVPGSWAGMARGRDPSVACALRLFPDQDHEGFFVCRLRAPQASRTSL